MKAAEIEGSANALVAGAHPQIDAARTLAALDEIEREMLGKASPLNRMREAIKDVDATERSVAGKAVAAARAELEEAVSQRRAALAAEARAAATR